MAPNPSAPVWYGGRGANKAGYAWNLPTRSFQQHPISAPPRRNEGKIAGEYRLNGIGVLFKDAGQHEPPTRLDSPAKFRR